MLSPEQEGRSSSSDDDGIGDMELTIFEPGAGGVRDGAAGDPGLLLADLDDDFLDADEGQPFVLDGDLHDPHGASVVRPMGILAPEINPGSTLAKSARLNTTMSYCASFALIGAALASLGPALEMLTEVTGLSLRTVSLAFPLRSAGYLAGSVIGGAVLHRATLPGSAGARRRRPGGGGGAAGGLAFFLRLPGPHAAIALSLLAAAVGLMLTPLCRGAVCLGGSSAVVGGGMGLLDTAGNALVVWLHGNAGGAAEPWMQGLHFSFAAGGLVAPFVQMGATSGGTNAAGLKWALGALAMAMVPVAVWVARRPEPALMPGADGADAVVDGRHEDDVAAMTRVGAGVPGAWALWRVRIVVALAALLLLLDVGAEVTFAGYIYLYGRNVASMPESDAESLTGLFWGALALGRLAAIFFSAAKISPAKMLAFDIGGCFLAMVFMVADPARSGTIHFASFLYGFSIASAFPSVLNLMAQYVPVSGFASGIVIVAAAVGEAAFPLALSYVFVEGVPSTFNALPVTLLVIAILSIFALAAMIFAGRRRGL
jgi:fucose permease